MPKALYGDQLLSNVPVMHYGQGIPLGRLEEMLDLPYSAMVQMLHRLARMLSGIPPRLIEQYRKSPVMHADETGRRTDGGNNLAERDLRPTVIARKVSFGSQSEEGAKTRGILMTVPHTLKKQFPADYQKRFKDALDGLAQNPKPDPYDFLFPS